ncbi:MAG: hypothetical protein IMZ46_03050 [Acidobacteria bacterium]|nr:hypothetical protein [Acidobacteriota bacterium]
MPLDEQELVGQVRAMAKVKAANRLQRLDKDQLTAVVTERTRALDQELAERTAELKRTILLVEDN